MSGVNSRNPLRGHIGGSLVLSPLHHPCSLGGISMIVLGLVVQKLINANQDEKLTKEFIYPVTNAVQCVVQC